MTKLTPRQEKFAELLVAGYGQAEAYRKAGYALKGKASIEAASRLAKHSNVLSRVAELRKPVLDRLEFNLETHLKDLREVRQLAIDTADLHLARETTVDMGKAAGFYIEKRHTTHANDSMRPLSDPELEDIVRDELARISGVTS